MKEYFFTNDYYLIPSSLKVFEKEGEFYALIARECPDCLGQQRHVGNCITCNGSGIRTPEIERLIKMESLRIFDEIPAFWKCPDFDHWKQSNSGALKLLYGDESNFAVGLKRQIDAGLFLTTKQLDSFNSSFNQYVEEPAIVKVVTPAPPTIPLSDEHSNSRYKKGDLVKVIISFTEIRAQYSKSSGCKFFTYTGITSLGGFAFTDKSQNAVELGESYSLAGKFRHFYSFESTPYAVISVSRLTRNAPPA
ncbi:hypothetical protein ABWC92_005435 [Escherichia coli]